MRNKPLVWSLLLGVAIVAAGGTAFAGENWVGSWKLNPAKSHLGANVVQAQTLTFQSTPAGIELTSTGTDAQGKPVKTGYVSKFDGKDVTWTGNSMADVASPKRIDDNNYENTWKKGGKATVTSRVSVSPDGKTLTITHTGTDAQGKPVSGFAVYDRQ
jgi:hypothetical protein